MAGDEPAPVCPSPKHLPLSTREREDHHGGVGFVGEFAVGELAPVDRRPCLYTTVMWGPLTAGSRMSVSVGLGFVIYFLDFYANFGK